MEISHNDQMKKYIVDQFKDREFDLIKEMPFMVSEVKTVTAEMRDWIIENSPENMPLIPSCYIHEKHIVKYTINMVKKGKLYLASNYNANDNVKSYSSMIILLESGHFHSFKYDALSDRDKKRFFSSVLRLMKRKKLSNVILASLSYKFNLKVLDAFKDETVLSKNLAYNLYTYLTFYNKYGNNNIEEMEKYYNIFHSLYFFNQYNDKINESDLPAFISFKYKLFKTSHFNTFNLLYSTGNDIYSKKNLSYYNMSESLKYILDKEGKLEVYFKREGVVKLYKHGYFKEKFFGDFIKKFQLYMQSLTDINSMINYTKYKTGDLK